MATTYQYRYLDNGDVVECVQSMTEPAFEQIDGRPVERIITGGYAARVDNWKPYVAASLVGKPGVDQLKHVPVTRKGITMMAPLIETRKQETEWAARNGHVRD